MKVEEVDKVILRECVRAGGSERWWGEKGKRRGEDRCDGEGVGREKRGAFELRGEVRLNEAQAGVWLSECDVDVEMVRREDGSRTKKSEELKASSWPGAETGRLHLSRRPCRSVRPSTSHLPDHQSQSITLARWC